MCIICAANKLRVCGDSSKTGGSPASEQTVQYRQHLELALDAPQLHHFIYCSHEKNAKHSFVIHLLLRFRLPALCHRMYLTS